MPNCVTVAVLLIQVHHKIKNSLRWGVINIIAECEKTCRQCPILRSYLVAACSFSKNETLSQLFFHSLQLVVLSTSPPELKTCYSKIQVNCRALSVNRDLVSLKTNILERKEGKFWFENFTKNCLTWFAKRQSIRE